MYAIVEVGSRQYKVAENDELVIERTLPSGVHKLSLDKVLLIAKDKTVRLGNPYLKDVKVNCEVRLKLKGKKRIAFKFRRRKNSQSKRGYRQKLILVKVKEIIGK